MDEQKTLPENKLVINYRRSGVKTLRGFAVFMIVAAIAAPILGIILSVTMETPVAFFASAIVSLNCIMVRALLLAFAVIAETHLLKKSEIMRSNDIVNADMLSQDKIKELQGGNIL